MAMSRPFCEHDLRIHLETVVLIAAVAFLFTEPIVFLLAIYIAIAYATLYAFFAAFPIVFQQHRHFSEGEGGLAFLGIGVGNIAGLSLAPVQNRLYWRAMDSNDGRTIPEG